MIHSRLVSTSNDFYSFIFFVIYLFLGYVKKRRLNVQKIFVEFQLHRQYMYRHVVIYINGVYGLYSWRYFGSLQKISLRSLQVSILPRKLRKLFKGCLELVMFRKLNQIASQISADSYSIFTINKGDINEKICFFLLTL